jgi:hypothetical protein
MNILRFFSKLVLVVSLILIIPVTSSCFNVTHESELTSAPQQFETHIDENQGFLISYPQDWTIIPEDILPAQQGLIVAYWATEAVNNFTPNLNIMIEPLDTDMSINTYFDAAEMHLKTIDGYKAISTEYLVINGIPAVKHVSRQKADNEVTSIAAQGFLIEDRTTWIITCICDSESYKSLESTFDTIINSFRFLN